MISKKPLDGISIKKLITGKAKNWPDRTIYNIQGAKKGNQAGVSLRTNDYRLDAFGKLYEIASDPGQRNDISKKHPELTEKLKKLQKQMADEMAPLFAASRLRPFHVGYGPLTDLPARDGIAHGGIQRSDRAPNHSFFTNWTSIEDKITWTVNVAEAGDYKACVYYACKKENVGCSIKLSSNHGDSTSKTVKKAFDPPLVGQSFDRVERKSESFVKDFKVLKLGTIALKKGNDTLTLSAPKITGDAAIDVLAIEMERL